MSGNGALRWAWVLLACMGACLGVAWALAASPDGEPVLGAAALVRYVLVALALFVVGGLLYRRWFRGDPGARRATAVTDTAVAVLFAGPVLFGVLVLASTIRDCSFGTGC